MANKPSAAVADLNVREPVDSNRAGWGIVLLLLVIAFNAHVNRLSIVTAGDTRIMAQYAIKPTLMGWVYSAFLITYTICMIPGGLVIDRLGSHRA